MRRCDKCKGLMERTVCPEHVEYLGGLVVKVLNATQVSDLHRLNEELVSIPDMEGLAYAAAISRALNPVRYERLRKWSFCHGRWI